MGLYPLSFSTSDEYLSVDIEKPTLLQNIVSIHLPAGTRFQDSMFSPGGGIMPFPVAVECYTQAVGFVEDNVFKGTYEIDYDYNFQAPPTLTLPFRQFSMRTEGLFQVNFK